MLTLEKLGYTTVLNKLFLIQTVFIECAIKAIACFDLKINLIRNMW